MTDFIYLIYIGLFVITIVYFFTNNEDKNIRTTIISKGPIVTESEATYSN